MSTAGVAPAVGLTHALLNGLAADGGLYLPESVPILREDVIEDLIGQPVDQIGRALAVPLFGRLDDTDVEASVAGALSFPIPLVRLTDHLYVLELFHGPTLAFKDVGAGVMARLLSGVRGERPLTVLTATSGDTGGAVAHALHGVPGIRVVVLYPEGRVSPRQERQFASLGGNVRAARVRGSFDDCQRLAKDAMSDAALRGTHGLTSANSINVGRLLPQVIYYAHLYGQLERSDAHTVVSVPCGNLGNITAGLMAKHMGVPIARLVAACNANDTFVRFINTGRSEPRASVCTLTTAMDVANPSNLARIRSLSGDDIGRLRREVSAYAVSDDQTRATIRDVHRRWGYVMDPHSAVGFHALETAMRETPGLVGVVLATAHPAKFAEIVEPVIGEPVPVPERFAAMLERNVDAVTIDAELAALEEVLR